jgi:hypothetical protein
MTTKTILMSFEEWAALNSALNFPAICYQTLAITGHMYSYRTPFNQLLEKAESQSEDDQIDAAFQLRTVQS